ncbi:CRISPR-associated protein%2C Cse3 family [Mycobacterium tuberculosis]|nr:CRISPR-associated protein%2C Cse3 family [Mycobacterium tuberculosis]
MTYLSRIRIDPLRAESRELLASPRAMHGAVIGGIPDPSQMDRVLWRLDADDPRCPLLFVLSPSRPDWTRLVEAAGRPGADGDQAATREYRPLLVRLAVRREFAFRVTANPVPEDPHALAQQLEWFIEHAAGWGFAIPDTRTGPAASDLDISSPHAARDVRVIARSRHSFTEGGRGTPVTLHTTTLAGRLLVTDVALLAHAMLKGIGPSRAYGCGLLTLTPCRKPS